MSIAKKLGQLIKFPLYTFEEDNLRSRVIFIISGATIIGCLSILALRIFTTYTDLLRTLVIVVILLFITQILLHIKKLKSATFLLLFTISGFIFYQLYTVPDGIHDSIILAIPGILIVAGLLLKKWQFYVFLFVICVLISIIGWIEYSGIKPTNFSESGTYFDLIYILVILLVTAIPISMLTQNVINNYIHAKQREIQLNELNITKDKFFSIISHDLKDPFNSIIGLSDLLVERIYEKDYNGIEEFANSIQDTGHNTMSLLLNLLEWANSQTGKLKYQPEQLNIESLINEVFELVKSSAQEKSIHTSTKIPPDCMVYADKAMISTVMRNLVSNAIKFTHPKGEIKISVVQKEDEMMVTVTDSGVGIDSNKINDLFRIEKITSTQGTKNEKGTGLGLHLCKEFIEKHDGRIWVESELGFGTSFYFTIPTIDRDV